MALSFITTTTNSSSQELRKISHGSLRSELQQITDKFISQFCRNWKWTTPQPLTAPTTTTHPSSTSFMYGFHPMQPMTMPYAAPTVLPPATSATHQGPILHFDNHFAVLRIPINEIHPGGTIQYTFPETIPHTDTLANQTPTSGQQGQTQRHDNNHATRITRTSSPALSLQSGTFSQNSHASTGRLHLPILTTRRAFPSIQQLLQWEVIKGRPYRTSLSNATLLRQLTKIRKVLIDANEHTNLHFTKLQVDLTQPSLFQHWQDTYNLHVSFHQINPEPPYQTKIQTEPEYDILHIRAGHLGTTTISNK